MDRFRAMRIFTRVVALGSFARAAAELGLSPPSVTLRVKELEAALGIRLLNRNTRRVSLTDDGKLYFDHCVQVLDDVRTMDETLARRANAPRGLLRVDVPVVLARLMVPRLSAFQERYPDLRLHVTMENRDNDLLGREIDCAIRIAEPPDSRLVVRRLGMLRWVTCAAPGYLARHGAPRHPDELARHRCLGYLAVGSLQLEPWHFEQDGRRVALPPSVALAFSSLDPLVEAAIHGLGIAQVADFAARPALAQGRLVRVLDDWEADGPPVCLLYASRRHLPEKVRAFTEFAGSLLAEA
jgi:LysR family transcriptional regulator for bpeEF and oprC